MQWEFVPSKSCDGKMLKSENMSQYFVNLLSIYCDGKTLGSECIVQCSGNTGLVSVVMATC